MSEAVDLSTIGADAPNPNANMPLLIVPGQTVNLRDAGPGPDGRGMTVLEVINPAVTTSLALTDDGLEQLIDRMKGIRSEHVKAKLAGGFGGHLPPINGRG